MDTPKHNPEFFAKARKDLGVDMQSRGIGAIIWDNSQAGFHYLPVVMAADAAPGDTPVVVEGMYLYDGVVYLMEEGICPVSVDNLYDPDTEVKPAVVTLDANDAGRMLGDPATQKGYTTEGTLEQWLAIADCYYEALNLTQNP